MSNEAMDTLLARAEDALGVPRHLRGSGELMSQNLAATVLGIVDVLVALAGEAVISGAITKEALLEELRQIEARQDRAEDAGGVPADAPARRARKLPARLLAESVACGPKAGDRVPAHSISGSSGG